MSIGQPPDRRAYAPEEAHRAWCEEQGDLKLEYLSSEFCVPSSAFWYLVARRGGHVRCKLEAQSRKLKV